MCSQSWQRVTVWHRFRLTSVLSTLLATPHTSSHSTIWMTNTSDKVLEPLFTMRMKTLIGRRKRLSFIWLSSRTDSKGVTVVMSSGSKRTRLAAGTGDSIDGSRVENAMPNEPESNHLKRSFLLTSSIPACLNSSIQMLVPKGRKTWSSLTKTTTQKHGSSLGRSVSKSRKSTQWLLRAFSTLLMFVKSKKHTAFKELSHTQSNILTSNSTWFLPMKLDWVSVFRLLQF